MSEPHLTAPIRPLRQRLIDDMNMRRFSPETQRNYICDVRRFATFVARSPDTATAEDLRRFQVEQREAGVPVPTMNSIVSAPRFFFTNTLDRPDFEPGLVRVTHPRKLPAVLSDNWGSLCAAWPPWHRDETKTRRRSVLTLNAWWSCFPFGSTPSVPRMDAKAVTLWPLPA
jgi:site-specific recombinase XerD